MPQKIPELYLALGVAGLIALVTIAIIVVLVTGIV